MYCNLQKTKRKAILVRLCSISMVSALQSLQKENRARKASPHPKPHSHFQVHILEQNSKVLNKLHLS